MKTCNTCLEKKGLEEFPKHKRYLDGVQPTCKKCKAAKAREYRIKNPDRVKAVAAKSRTKNAKVIKERKAKYYQDNKEQIQNRIKEKRKDLEFRKKENERSKRYYSRSRCSRLRKKLRGRANFTGWTNQEIDLYLTGTFLMRYGRLPSEKDALHVDHIVPLSWASSEEELKRLHVPTNIQLLLAADNLKKNNYIADYTEGVLQ